MRKCPLTSALLLFALLALPTLAVAAPLPPTGDKASPGETREHFEIVMTPTGGFEPLELVVPAYEKIEIIVKNHSQTPIEFDCPELKSTKIVHPHRIISFQLNGIKPKTYRYVDAFNGEFKGFITAK